MPKAESPFTKHPYCGGCGTMLEVKDLFPGFSYPMLGGKCRHCSMSIPSIYWWTEIFCAVIFMWAVVTYGWQEAYLPVVLGGTVAVTLWGLEMRSGRIFGSALLFLASIGVVYRTLLDGTIYDATYGLIWGAMVPLIIWRLRADPENLNGEKARLSIPLTAILGATAGLWLGAFGLLLFVPLWGISVVAYKAIAKTKAAWPDHSDTVPFVFALMLMVLNPYWIVWSKSLFVSAY
ncbi:MAG: prepilin peptidase [Alphaproteobacteria bacterium]|nr:prepilin peptidase [Alphaproteobacteria bacterium]